MNILELFSGTERFSKVARNYGHNTFTVDNDIQHNPNLCIDIFEFNVSMIPYKPDVIWASPPCTCFSVASIGTHWNKDYTPKTANADIALMLVEKTLNLIKEINPMYWFVENPRGMLRKLMPIDINWQRRTVTYCQYGDTRMKPTDIWTNCDKWVSLPACKNGDKCHEPAPRGTKQGTQKLNGSVERSRIPEKLCQEIILAIG